MKNIIVVFVGSFNPPINSHFSIAEQIINEYEEIDKIIFVPVNSKYNKQELLENRHRYNMLKIVCDKNPHFEVSSIEINSDKYVYTIETLEIIKNQYPKKEVWLTIGSDNLKEIDTWKNAEEIVKNFKVLVHERGNDSVDEIIENNEFLKRNKNSIITMRNSVISNLSSTFVRNEIKEGKSIKYLIPDEVNTYITKNKLFMKEEK